MSKGFEGFTEQWASNYSKQVGVKAVPLDLKASKGKGGKKGAPSMQTEDIQALYEAQRSFHEELDRVAPKKSKLRNKRCTYNGMNFDSEKELKHWKNLELLQKAGKISDLKRQVNFKLVVNDFLICTYRADMTYVEEGELKIADVKGWKGGDRYTMFTMKRKLLFATLGLAIIEI